MSDKHEWPLIEPGAINKLKEMRAEVERLRAELREVTQNSSRLRPMVEREGREGMDNEQLEQSMRYARSVPSETPEGLPINSDIKVLAAEVERLQKVVADQALTIACLRDDSARKTAEVDGYQKKHERDFIALEKLSFVEQTLTSIPIGQAYSSALDDLRTLRQEAQTARLALDVATKEIEVVPAPPSNQGR